MRTYSSKTPTINIPLEEFQRLTLDSRILDRMMERSNKAAELRDRYADELHEEDMKDG